MSLSLQVSSVNEVPYREKNHAQNNESSASLSLHQHLFVQSPIEAQPILSSCVIRLFNPFQLETLQCFVNQSDFAQAILFFSKEITLSQSEIFMRLTLEKALEGFSDPQKTIFCQQLATLYFKRDQRDLAKSAVEVGLKFPALPEIQGRLFYIQGFLFLEENELDRGIEALNNAYLLLQTGNLDVFVLCKLCYGWAKALYLQNRYSQSELVLLKLENCNELDLNDPTQLVIKTRLCYLLAKCFERKGRFQEITLLLKRGVEGVSLLPRIDQILYHSLWEKSLSLFSEEESSVDYFPKLPSDLSDSPG